MKTLILNKYGKERPITFYLDNYLQNGNLYVGMITHEEGYPEPWSDLTVNLGVECKANCAYIDTNNNGDAIIAWLCENNLGYPTGHMRPSGFCIYPEFEFNMDVLMQYVEWR